MENYFIKENSVGKAWQEAMKTIIEKERLHLMIMKNYMKF